MGPEGPHTRSAPIPPCTFYSMAILITYYGPPSKSNSRSARFVYRVIGIIMSPYHRNQIAQCPRHPREPAILHQFLAQPLCVELAPVPKMVRYKVDRVPGSWKGRGIEFTKWRHAKGLRSLMNIHTWTLSHSLLMIRGHKRLEVLPQKEAECALRWNAELSRRKTGEVSFPVWRLAPHTLASCQCRYPTSTQAVFSPSWLKRDKPTKAKPL